MLGFFKQWAANATEYASMQQELKVIFAQSGVNFMHLHPEITKFLVGFALEEGASEAVAKLNEMAEMLANEFPDSTQEQSQQQLIRLLKNVNTLARQKIPQKSDTKLGKVATTKQWEALQNNHKDDLCAWSREKVVAHKPVVQSPNDPPAQSTRRLSITCPHCGALIRPTSSFCPECTLYLK